MTETKSGVCYFCGKPTKGLTVEGRHYLGLRLAELVRFRTAWVCSEEACLDRYHEISDADEEDVFAFFREAAKANEADRAIRKELAIESTTDGYRLEVDFGGENFFGVTYPTVEAAEEAKRQILGTVVGQVADDLDEAEVRARGMAQELADVLGCKTQHWPLLIGKAESLRKKVEAKLQIQNIIQILSGAEALMHITDLIELQLSDEAVYEHLKTCADVLDDEDQKRMLRDAAELFADEFCNNG